MKHLLLGLTLLLGGSGIAQTQTCQPPTGKAVYIPKELWENDFTKAESKWSYARMATTPDVVVFWEKAFGDDLSKAPDLDGHNMKVDLGNLLQRLQGFYSFYKDSLQFILPGSKADKYRMMVMLNYSLEGTAYGGDYDNEIGALWITPGRAQDEKLNAIAHELGHSFQAQIGADHTGKSWGGGGIFEMTSQWMLWQVNPQWPLDENYHWQAFRESHNKRFLDVENIYRSPYVLEYWSTKHGIREIGRLFRVGLCDEDPAQTYMRVHGLSLQQMNQEMTDCYSHLALMDFPRVKQANQQLAGELAGPVQKPGTWGFGVLDIPATARKIEFKNNSTDSNASFLYQVVERDADGTCRYMGILSGDSRTWSVKKPKEGTSRYLVVVACPRNTYSPYTFNPYQPGSQSAPDTDYSYDVKFK